MGQTAKKNGRAYGTCDRCGRAFDKAARGQPYRFCSRQCSVDPVASRFAKLVHRGPGCWPWTGKKNPEGYGEIQVNHRIVKAHRLSYELATGEKIPPKTEVCHKCDNPSCVNPNHLFLGDHSANMRDMVKKGRGRQPKLAGEACGASKLTLAQVLEIRSAPGVHKAIARQFGISQTQVSRIKRRATWQHVA